VISSRDLCTLAIAKAYISPKLGQTADDVLLQKFIGRASGWIEKHLSRKLALATYSERRNGTGTPSILTKGYPIIAVQGIWIGNTQLQAAPVTTGNQSLCGGGYVENERFIYIRAGYGPGGFGEFPRGVQNVLLQYQAGYLTPGILALLALPAWQPNQNYAQGAQLVAGSMTFLATTPGRSGAAAPAWPTQTGLTVTDGTVTWIAVEAYTGPTAGAELLPEPLETAAMELVALQYKQKDRTGDSGTGLGPERINYFMGAMSATTKESLKPFRDTVPMWELQP
jgi:hypothetical protein